MKLRDDSAKRLSAEEETIEGRIEIGTRTTNYEWDYEQILERIGFGKTQWMLLLISGLLTITSMSGVASAGIIAISSQCEFETTLADKGMMMAASIAGVTISTYFWGYVSDAIGRRTVLLYSVIIANFLQFMTIFITNIWVFNLTNFLMGICLGGISSSLYAYLSEFTILKHRAVVINYSTMFVSVTNVYVPAIAWLLLSFDWSLPVTESYSLRPWRVLLVFCLLPGFLGALLLLPFPESPKLLLAQQKNAEALAAVEWICKYNTRKSLASVMQSEVLSLRHEELDGDVKLSKSGLCGILKSIWQATMPLFQKPHGVNFIISTVAVFGMFFGSNGMQIWYPEIVNRAAAGAAAGAESMPVCGILDSAFSQQTPNATQLQSAHCDDSITTKTYIDSIIMGVAFLIGFSIQGMLLNPLGRKNVALTVMSLATLSGILLHFVSNTTLVLILFCLYILMPGLSISIMLGALVDFVPTHLRGKAVSIVMTFGRLGVIVASNLMGVMLAPLCNTTFAVFTCMLLICTFLIHLLPFK